MSRRRDAVRIIERNEKFQFYKDLNETKRDLETMTNVCAKLANCMGLPPGLFNTEESAKAKDRQMQDMFISDYSDMINSIGTVFSNNIKNIIFNGGMVNEPKEE